MSSFTCDRCNEEFEVAVDGDPFTSISVSYHDDDRKDFAVSFCQQCGDEVLEDVHVVPTFTAHPTEARRKTVKGILQRVGRILESLDERRLTDEEETALNIGRPPGAEPQENEITNAEVQVDIASGAAAPALKVYATVSNAVTGGAGLVRHIVKTARNAGGAGERTLEDVFLEVTSEDPAADEATLEGATDVQ